MSHRYRVGIYIPDDDWYWKQVSVGIAQRAHELAIDLVALSDVTYGLPAQPGEELIDWLEQRQPLELDALMGMGVVQPSWYRILDRGLPIVSLTETDLQHPLLVVPSGLDEIAYTVGTDVARRLHGHGNVWIVGGLMDVGEAGRTRLKGLQQALQAYPEIHWQHIPSLWGYGHAYAQTYPTFLHTNTSIDAIIGLIDPIALATYDAARALDLSGSQTIVVGFGGYPIALTAIAQGYMTATVDLSPAQFGCQALDYALQSIQRCTSPRRFFYHARCLFAADVKSKRGQVQHLSSSSNLTQEEPSQNLQRLSPLELDRVINALSGTTLERRQLLHGIASLIRANYCYDYVQILRWIADEQVLVGEQWQQGSSEEVRIPSAEVEVFAQVLRHKLPIFIADTQQSDRFPPDPRWPQTRTRVITLIALGDTILGLLDLHCYHVRDLSVEDFKSAEHIGVRLGLSMRSAELYQEALKAQARAEQADRLKTRLLANVSHELRTPLNTILNYTQGALSNTDAATGNLSSEIQYDLRQIAHNAEHLIRLINDLLDLSRAEIDELTIAPQMIAPHRFLTEIFHNFADNDENQGTVAWKLHLPEQLPLIKVDPVRLRQILFNLLDNARKFTSRGFILLGAEVVPPHLHLWVQDSGSGIPVEQQERIFEPFVTGDQARRRPEGVGLGLAITRRLLTLHHGHLTLESQSEHGSTFHISLPLPHLSEQATYPSTITQPVLLLISASEHPPSTILELCQRQGLQMRRLEQHDDVAAVWSELQPQLIAWDVLHATAHDRALLEQLRRHERFCHLPFLLFGQGEGDTPELMVGMTNVLTKPVERHTLTTMIETMCATTTQGSILLIDDDQQTCELYRRLVAQTFPCHTITTATSGATALEILSESIPSVPDLVILDLVMPGIDGFGVLDYLRATPETRNVPVLVLSGRILSHEDVERLNHAHVIFQCKDLLEPDELSGLLHHATTTLALVPQTSILIKEFIVYIQQHYDRKMSLQEMAAAIGVSSRHLNRIVRQELGLSPWEYLNRYRIKQARRLLQENVATISGIALRVGFDDPQHFSRVFRQYTGCSPRDYREHHS